MKYLTLIRHAEAQVQSGSPDIERLLSTYGSQMAPVMGRRLESQGVEPDIVYTSPSARTKETAKILCYEIGFPLEKIEIKDEIYRASLMNLFTLIQAANEDLKHLMLIGHNPTITEFANALCKDHQISHMATCGVFKVALDVDYWALVNEGSGQFIEYDTPENMSA